MYALIDRDGRLQAVLDAAYDPGDGYSVVAVPDAELDHEYAEYRYDGEGLVHDPTSEQEFAATQLDPIEAIVAVLSENINAMEVPDETALKVVGLYPKWSAGTSYETGFRVSHALALWSCLQAHVSQDGWEPGKAPSLWAKVLVPDPEVVPEWEQPDSTNPYMKGDKVRHNGLVWESDVDGNVWEPGVYGWHAVEGVQ